MWNQVLKNVEKYAEFWFYQKNTFNKKEIRSSKKMRSTQIMRKEILSKTMKLSNRALPDTTAEFIWWLVNVSKNVHIIKLIILHVKSKKNQCVALKFAGFAVRTPLVILNIVHIDLTAILRSSLINHRHIFWIQYGKKNWNKKILQRRFTRRFSEFSLNSKILKN